MSTDDEKRLPPARNGVDGQDGIVRRSPGRRPTYGQIDDQGAWSLIAAHSSYRCHVDIELISVDKVCGRKQSVEV